MASSPLGIWLKEQLENRHLSQNAFVAYIGLSKGTISDIINKGHTPKAEILRVIADYFHEPHEKVFRLAGLLPANGHTNPEAEEVVHLFQQLGETEKKLALRALRAWVEGKEEEEKINHP